MSSLFSMQENSFLGHKAENIVEDKLKNKYRICFRRCCKYKDSIFTQILFKEIKDLNEIEKTQILNEILFYVMNDYKGTQHKYLKKIKDGKEIKRKYINKSKKMKCNLNHIFKNLWSNIKEQKINISFEDMVDIYRLQYEILFNEMQIYCLSNGKKVIEEIYPANKYINDISENSSCFQIPDIIWNKVSNYKELIELNISISRMFIREKHLDINEGLDNNNRWLEEYEEYVELILQKYKEFCNTKEKNSLKNIFGIYTWNTSGEKIGNETQNIIFQYIINLEYDSHNKQYVKFLLKELDYKYTIIFIFYMMLYADNSSKLEWKKNIVSLKTICHMLMVIYKVTLKLFVSL